MEDLKLLADRIAELAAQSETGPFFYGPVPEARLTEAERELGVTISGSFRAYLLYIGGSKMLGYDFNGLPDVILNQA
jgi:hypothetical protein